MTPATSVRGLQVLDVHLQRDPQGGYEVAGTLRNDTTVEAAVPHLLLAYTAANGQLAWVDHAFLAHSVGPQSSSPFQVQVAASSPIKPSGVPTSGYAGPSHTPPVHALGPMLSLPASTGFAAVSLTATSYSRGVQQ